MYPALAVLRHLMLVQPTELQTLWVGGIGGMEADLVKREFLAEQSGKQAGVQYAAIPAAGVHGVSVRALPGNLWQLGRGLLAAFGLLRKFRPDVLFFTGGYVAVPVALAARLAGRGRALLYVPDIEPGLALKTLARFADRIALTTEDSLRFFAGRRNLSVTGYPLRPDLLAAASRLEVEGKAAARKVFDLRPDLPVLLVFGGSKVSRSINRAVMAALPELLQEMQVLHISGQLDWPEVEQARLSLSPEGAPRYRLYPYLHDEMAAALACADLALTRAGAYCLGELPLFGLPAILVPYPYAWRYQRVNADYLASRGAAEVVEDADLAGQIVPLVRGLLADPSRRQQMAQAMRQLARPAAAEQIAALLSDLASAGQAGGTAGLASGRRN